MADIPENRAPQWLSDWYRQRTQEDEGGGIESNATSHDQVLVHLDPESEEHFDFLVDIIAEEIAVQRAIRPEEFESAEGIRAVAELVADEVLDGFQMRRRTVNMKRYEWQERDNEPPTS